MFRKGWIIITIVLIVATGIFFLNRLSFRVKKEITVNASLFIVSSQITDLHKWQKWYPEVQNTDSTLIKYSGGRTKVNSFLQIGDHRYTVTRVNPEEINIKEQTGKKLIYHSVIAVSDKLGIHSRVQWSANLDLFSWINEKIHAGSNIENNLKSLKRYIEDPSLYYGFPIEIKQVTDTLLISKKDTVPVTEASVRLSQLFDDLLLYAHKHRLSVENSKIYGVFPAGKDQAEVIANLTVHHKATESNGIVYLQMPEGGKIVTTTYTGPYSGITKAHKALQQYIIDKLLKRVALSYEKFYGDQLPVNDSGNVKVEVCYPVF